MGRGRTVQGFHQHDETRQLQTSYLVTSIKSAEEEDESPMGNPPDSWKTFCMIFERDLKKQKGIT